MAILFVLPNISALKFQFNSPDEANQDESFKIQISSQEDIQNSYDVKIFVHQASKEFCEIFSNNKWESPYYYIKEVFPQEKEFEMLSHYAGETKICARLRNSQKPDSGFSEVCNPITIHETEQPDEDSSEDKEPETKKEQPASVQNQTVQQISFSQPQTETNEKIILSSQTQAKTIYTKTEKLRLGIIYSFTIFCVVVIILLALRKL